MRHIYKTSDETIKVLKGHEQGVAEEMHVTPRYIYAVLSGSETDRFAAFLELYAAAIRDGSPVRHWEERMAEVKERSERRETLSLQHETARFAQEATDVSVAHIEGGDAHTLLREAREAIAQGKRLERAALDVIEAQERPRKPYSDARQKAKAVTLSKFGNGGRTR